MSAAAFTPPAGPVAGCALCESAGGRLLFENASLRVIHAQEAGFPAFYRVVWREHAREFTDLGRAQRMHCVDAVAAVESALRAHLAPTKVNVATLGNAVPHLHWHVIARFDWDSHFPAPVWAGAAREAPADRLAAVEARLPALERELLAQLGALPPT
ncbi:MAG: HIT family protein [Rhodocyclaceae bacterium]|nr:HIT family protein [Pseudomonadota bacterium]MDQ7972687.1 HIT family protein [Rhodocyclaceae bacterium]MDQ8001840.1 HIT family protein [Pseudomonadota bacterium]MDQ8018026.1 HIT family protein [Pseudomonadota bacterium]